MVYWVAFIAIDLIIYMFLGLLQMGYDDHYTESKGEYWSWNSMNTQEWWVNVAFYCWNMLNLITLLWLTKKAYLFIKKIRAES